MFTALEVKVMELLLTGAIPANEGITVNTVQMLWAQWQQASLGKREWTEVGFFTSFELPEVVESTVPVNFVLNHVAAQMKGFKQEVSFLLFVRNGKLDTLEGYSIEDPSMVWHEHIEVLAVYRTEASH